MARLGLAQATSSKTRRDWVARLGGRPRLRRDLQQDKATKMLREDERLMHEPVI